MNPFPQSAAVELQERAPEFDVDASQELAQLRAIADRLVECVMLGAKQKLIMNDAQMQSDYKLSPLEVSNVAEAQQPSLARSHVSSSIEMM